VFTMRETNADLSQIQIKSMLMVLVPVERVQNLNIHYLKFQTYAVGYNHVDFKIVTLRILL
jgi:hypothetical protein